MEGNYPVELSIEPPRGCGYRKSGKGGVGIYLVGSAFNESCERLPFPLDKCPCCGGGITFSRGFRWVQPSAIFAPSRPPLCSQLASPFHQHSLCYMCAPPAEKHGLMWVGDKFYSPESFLTEANTQGISKRIAAIPRDFVPGHTIVYLAHIKACMVEQEKEGALFAEPAPAPGIFGVFRPKLELVINAENEVPERARKIYDAYGPEHTRIVVVQEAPAPTELAAVEEP